MNTEIKFNQDELNLIKLLCDIYLHHNRGVLETEQEINIENLSEDLNKVERYFKEV